MQSLNTLGPCSPVGQLVPKLDSMMCDPAWPAVMVGHTEQDWPFPLAMLDPENEPRYLAAEMHLWRARRIIALAEPGAERGRQHRSTHHASLEKIGNFCSVMLVRNALLNASRGYM